MSSIQITALVIILLYMAATVAIGLIVSKRKQAKAKKQSNDDFLMASKSLGPVVLAGTLFAANTGGASTTGIATNVHTYGLSACWYVVAAGIGFVLVSFIAPYFRKAQANTVPEIISKRYGKASHIFTAFTSIAALFMATGAQIIATASIINVVTGVSFQTAAIITTVVVILYTMVGGFASAGLDGDSDAIDWTFETTENYLNMIDEAKPGLNECYLVPHGNIRMEAMGLENRLPNEEELEKMRRITRREMEAGAVGLSTGLIYMPCAYSESKEIIEMCKVVAEYDGIFVIHQRSEADTILDSMEEVIKIGRESGVKIHYSHFKVCGKKNWDKIEKVIELLEAAKAEGIRVSFDQYPYVAGSTMLGVILPPWVHDGGTDKVLERLADPELRKKMVYDIEHGIPGWDNFVEFAGLDQIFVTSVKTEKNKDAIGLSLTALGELRGKDPYEATFDLLYEEENAVGMVDFYGTEEHVIRFMKRPEMNACTDGLLGGKPHPRVYGAFPRILGKYVREEKALTLEEAVYKMTKKPAMTFNMTGRGELKEGYAADICIFNPDTVIDKGTFVEPIQYPEGIEYVIVGGVVTVEKGKHTGRRNGAVLRMKGKEVVR